MIRLAAAGLVVLVSACAGPRLGDSEAALVLEALLHPSGSRLAASTPVVQVREVHAAAGARSGDLYDLGLRPRAGVVLVPGLAPAGKNDPRIRAFAHVDLAPTPDDVPVLLEAVQAVLDLRQP